MRRTTVRSAILAGFLVAAATGCDEWPKVSPEKPKSDSTELTKKSAGETTPPKDKPLDFAGFPTTDPIQQAVQKNRQVVVEREEELLAKLDTIRTLLASARPRVASEKRSVREFLHVTAEVRDAVTQADEALVGLSSALDGLTRELKHAPTAYRRAAENFRERADDYAEAKLREQLLAFADEYEAIADTFPDRMTQLRQFQRKLPAMKVKVREARSFLDDLRLFLESHPGIGVDDPRERYAAQLEAFVHSFSELLRTLDEFRSVLRSRALSATIRAGYERDALATWNAVLPVVRREKARLLEVMNGVTAQLVALASHAEGTRDLVRGTPPSPPDRIPTVTEIRSPTPPARAASFAVQRVIPACRSHHVVYSSRVIVECPPVVWYGPPTYRCR